MEIPQLKNYKKERPKLIKFKERSDVNTCSIIIKEYF